MATAVISGRVDERTRQKADLVMRKAGLTPTDVIQSVWASMAETGEVPDIAQPAAATAKRHGAMNRLNRFLFSLPPVNTQFADWSDDDIMALKVRDYE